MVAVPSAVPYRSIGIVLTHLPVILIASMILPSSGLGGHRIMLEPLIPATMAALSVTLLAIALYARVRELSPKLAQATFYAGLWFAFPIAGIKLSYLALSLGFPLQDQAFARFDAALGFDWTAWAMFVEAHPLLRQVQEFAYASHSWQPMLTVAVLAVWGPAERNKELLTNVLLALLIVTAVSALAPAISPADSRGIPTLSGGVVMQLRDGLPHLLPSVGIICFPSFHTVLAVLFTTAHRGLRTFLPMLLLNLVMLTSVPYSGDHYLSDILAGIAAALLAMRLTLFLAAAEDSLGSEFHLPVPAALSRLLASRIRVGDVP